jgi:hypothetical protein
MLVEMNLESLGRGRLVDLQIHTFGSGIRTRIPPSDTLYYFVDQSKCPGGISM